MAPPERCPICDNPNSSIIPGGMQEKKIHTFHYVTCPSCGRYRISSLLCEFGFDGIPEFQKRKYILMGLLRLNSEKNINNSLDSDKEIITLLDSANIPDGPLEKMDMILQYIEKREKYSGEGVPIYDYHDFTICFSQNRDEFLYLLRLIREMDYIEIDSGSIYRLKPDGWKRLSQIKTVKRDSNTAFVAMWFNKQMDEFYENGFSKALNDTGYNPIRIDLTEHNDKICDRIIAEIRKSGLLIADFTENRGGVYFEAGFALGLGIPVIWTCQKEFFDKNEMHFDTRQYNHIIWESSDDLYEKLKNRIEATLPNRKTRSFS